MHVHHMWFVRRALGPVAKRYAPWRFGAARQSTRGSLWTGLKFKYTSDVMRETMGRRTVLTMLEAGSRLLGSDVDFPFFS